MLRQKRKEVEVFSLSFMDCICCGFGAVMLLFILTTGQKTNFTEADLTELRERIATMEREISTEQAEIERLAKALAVVDVNLDGLREEDATDKETKVSQRKNELQLLLQQVSTLKDALAKLLEEQQAIPTQEEPPAISIPNVDRRQYLTGIRMEGEHVLFIVRASGSMLDETIEGASDRLDDPDFKKREAPKWQRTLRSLEWLLASLEPETKFQILLFNDEVTPLLQSRPDDWISPDDRTSINEVLNRLRQVVPKGAANLERAFSTVRYMPQLPDSIVLITDGLPTRSDSMLSEGEVGETQRIRFFEIAIRQLPPRIPVSTILLPFSGDPAGPALFWELANTTRGALVSPAKSWPDT
ncbi:hypothetical protein MASR2M8_00740 [Opitutaceae bacterium]